MKVYIANDHGGVELKNRIIAEYEPKGYEFINLGTDTSDIVRYPYYAEQVAKHVAQEEDARGILICSTGIGMSIAANKFKGIRAALCTDGYMAKMTRMHNDSNVLCLGGQVAGILKSLEMVGIWLSTDFEGGRHCISLDLLAEIDNALVKEPPAESVMTPGR